LFQQRHGVWRYGFTLTIITKRLFNVVIKATQKAADRIDSGKSSLSRKQQNSE